MIINVQCEPDPDPEHKRNMGCGVEETFLLIYFLNFVKIILLTFQSDI